MQPVITMQAISCWVSDVMPLVQDERVCADSGKNRLDDTHKYKRELKIADSRKHKTGCKHRHKRNNRSEQSCGAELLYVAEGPADCAYRKHGRNIAKAAVRRHCYVAEYRAARDG